MMDGDHDRVLGHHEIVMSPRRRSDSSYAAQFRTRYFVLYFSVTLLFVRAAILVVSGG